MHSYSIDREERKGVLLVLAIVSIVLAWAVHKVLVSYEMSLPWWVESPSVLFFYGFLFFVCDRWLWQALRKAGVIKTPNLNGEWEGLLKSSFDEHATGVEAMLRVFQTWTKIKILLKTDKSCSHSETASIIIDAPEGKYLNYQYLNEPKSSSEKTMSIHRGTARLLFDEKTGSLDGEYYSGRDRQNIGTLHFERLR